MRTSFSVMMFSFLLLSIATMADGKKALRIIDQLGTAVGMGDQKKFTDLLPKVKAIDEELNSIGETVLTLNHQTKNGYSALIFNSMAMIPPAENATKTAKLLLNAGADTQLKNSDGDTAYSLAVKKNQLELASLLK